MTFNNSKEDIAIIGISCRVPGAKNYREMWDNLCAGKESIRHISKEELLKFGVSEEKINHPNFIPAIARIDNVEFFDANFFEMTPREATMLDPQHRFFLESAWSALEDGGYAHPEKKQNIGVFAGFGSILSSYLLYYLKAHPEIEGRTINAELFSLDRDYGATRTCFKLNLSGPAMDVQTACSTSLVAAHLACDAILNGSCDMALAGGVSIHPSNYTGYIHESGGPESEDGHIRAYDAKASGTIFGNGVGIVLLKKLSAAIKDKDHIYAVIKGSALNNDGHRKKNFASPSVEGQKECIIEALNKSQINPNTISYVLAHGTATLVGDPIEVKSLSEAFKKWTKNKQFCALGSIKPNLSHLDSAAGVMNLIVSALALYYKKIPPNINFETPNPEINFKDSPFYVNTELKSLEPIDGVRRVLTTAFGVGGTNASIVLEEFPCPISLPSQNNQWLFPFSAKTQSSLEKQKKQFIEFLTVSPGQNLDNISYTLANRYPFTERFAVIANSQEELIEKLKNNEGFSGSLIQNHVPKIAFLFSGQGSQYSGMCQDLYESNSIFKEWIDKCDHILSNKLDISLLDLLFKSNDKKLSETQYTQPVLFSIEYSLFKVLEYFGLKPHFVLGHSLGEYVAAACANVISLEDGLEIAVKRGELIQNLPLNGAMHAILAPAEEVEIAIKDHDLSIAGYNGIGQTVVSGEKTKVEAFTASFKEKGITVIPLQVSHAFHSSLLEPILNPFRKVILRFAYHPPKYALISNLTGKIIEGDEISADYWVKHLISPVKFTESIQTLEQEGCHIFIEIGPQPVLLHATYNTLKHKEKAILIPLLKKETSSQQTILSCIAQVFANGNNVSWQHLLNQSGRQVTLPTYSFQREKFWVEVENVEQNAAIHAGVEDPNQPLIGASWENSLGVIEFDKRLNLKEYRAEYLNDHIILNRVLFPATGFVEIMAEAAKHTLQKSSFILENIKIDAPLDLTDSHAPLIETEVEKKDESYQISISSQLEKGKWTHHARGIISLNSPQKKNVTLDTQNIIKTDKEFKNNYYKISAEQGYEYGPHFQAVENFYEDSFLKGYLTLPTKRYGEIIHPILLDGCLQLAGQAAALKNSNWKDPKKEIALPVAIDKLVVYEVLPNEIICHVSKIEFEENTYKAFLSIFNDKGNLVAEIEGATFQKAAKTTITANLLKKRLADLFYLEQWEEMPIQEISNKTKSHFLILESAVHSKINTFFEEKLKAFGNEVTLFNFNNNSSLEHFWEIIRADDNVKIVDLTFLVSNSNSPLSEILVTEIINHKIKSFTEFLHKLVNSELKALPTVYVLTQGLWARSPEESCAISPLIGFRRGLFHEIPNFNFSILDIDFTTLLNHGIEQIIEDIKIEQEDREISYRSGKRFVNRLIRYEDWKNRHQILSLPLQGYYRLNKGEIQSSLDHLAFQEYTPPIIGKEEVELSIRAVGLNFRDLLNAMNLYPGDAGYIGTDCVGIVNKIGSHVTNCKVGDIVLGFANGCLGNYTKTTCQLVTPIPNKMLLPQAASIPTIFLTAFYALIKLANIKRGDKILIHAAAGGVGLAAIQVAKHVGAEIYATCSSTLKKEYLQNLGIQNIYDSRSLTYAEGILNDTKGKGVDVILNSLSGEGFIETSLNCLKKEGVFLEIGKRNIWSLEQMKAARSEVKYFIIALDEMIKNDPEEIQTLLKEVMSYFEKEVYRPIHYTSFPLNQIKEALQYLQTAKQIGKVVVEIPPPWKEDLQEEKSYLITGGLGGIGLTMADWLIQNGAKHLILLGRKGPNAETSLKIANWQKKGISIVIKNIDIANKQDVEKLFDELMSSYSPSLAGILHAAGVLLVEPIMKINWENYRDSFAAKIFGSLYLNNAVIKHKLKLDFFIHFSSNSSITGAPGQLGYCGANAFVDSFARYQFNLGIPVVSLNWALWAQVGMGLNYQEHSINVGYTLIEPQAAFSILDYSLQNQFMNVCVMHLDWKTYTSKVSENDLRVKHLVQTAANAKKEDYQAIFNELIEKPEEEWEEIIATQLQEITRRVIGAPKTSTIDIEMPFNQLGLDSLARNEFIAKVEKLLGYKKKINFTLLNKYQNIKTFSNFLCGEVKDILNSQKKEEKVSAP